MRPGYPVNSRVQLLPLEILLMPGRSPRLDKNPEPPEPDNRHGGKSAILKQTGSTIAIRNFVDAWKKPRASQNPAPPEPENNRFN